MKLHFSKTLAAKTWLVTYRPTQRWHCRPGRRGILQFHFRFRVTSRKTRDEKDLTWSPSPWGCGHLCRKCTIYSHRQLAGWLWYDSDNHNVLTCPSKRNWQRCWPSGQSSPPKEREREKKKELDLWLASDGHFMGWNWALWGSIWFTLQLTFIEAFTSQYLHLTHEMYFLSCSLLFILWANLCIHFLRQYLPCIYAIFIWYFSWLFLWGTF